ncbi:uncharacterized protein TNCV_4266581 [Trichonephila clavipes]|nr:uncharacterized protein TNCV_4266581 [Trichonephila clavipes]
MPKIKIDDNCLFEEERQLNAYLNPNTLEQHAESHRTPNGVEVSLSRSVGIVRTEDVLEQTALLRAGGAVPEEQVRQQHPGVSEGEATAQAQRKGETESAGTERRPGTHSPVSQLLCGGSQKGYPGNWWKEVQQNHLGTSVLPVALLWKRIQHTSKDSTLLACYD